MLLIFLPFYALPDLFVSLPLLLLTVDIAELFDFVILQR